MKTRDKDIRDFLHRNLEIEFKNDPDTIVVDELNLCKGDARIDIAVVNGAFHGYEIKSESDTLERLPNQISIYNQVMNTVTIVTGACHADRVIDMVPTWWGVSITSRDINGELYLINEREPDANPEVNPLAVAQLLWREEALCILKELDLHKGYLSKPRNILWERLSTNVPLEDLQFYVRKQLKNRKDWRVGLLQR